MLKQTILCISMLMLCLIALAEVPPLVNYQGRLTDTGGNPLTGTYSITFTIYDAASSGNSKWTETQSTVSVANGLFNVLLGSVTPILDTVFNDDVRYLGITIGADPEIIPRSRIVSVGYAMRANKSDTAAYATSSGGVGGWSDNGTTINLTTETDVVVVGETTPTTPSLKFDIRGHGGSASPLLRLYFNSSSPVDLTYPAFQIYNPSYDYTPFTVVGGGAIIQQFGGAKAGTVTNMIDPDPDNVTFFNAGDIGIGTDAPTNKLHVVGNDTQPILHVEQNGSGRGARFRSTSACALWVENAGNHGLRISNASGDGIHVENAGGHAGSFAGSGYFRDNVGIGVPSPTDKLEVDGFIHSTTGGFRFPDGSTQATAADASGITEVVANEGLQGGGSGGSVTLGIGDNGVSTSKIANNAVVGVKLADNAVTNIKIADDAVNSDKIEDISITSIDIVNSAIITSKLADLSVTNEKLANNAITAEKIENGSIVNIDIHSAADISPGKISGTAATLDGFQTFTGQNHFDAKVSYFDSAMVVNSRGVRIGDGEDPDNNELLCVEATLNAASPVKGIISNIVNRGPGNLYGIDAVVFDSGMGGNVTGINAYANSENGNRYGVYSYSICTNSNHNTYGVMGQAVGGNTAIGVYGYGINALNNWAGWFDGDIRVLGTVDDSKSSYMIDHPLDPENKFLRQESVHSSDMMNIYNGNVITDGNGEAFVILPDYFGALNKDFRYQLTVIGGFAQAVISEEINNNQFTIMTDKPNVKVSWQVTGIRKDAFAEANQTVNEPEKADNEIGLYRHPELFGHGDEKSIDYQRRNKAESDLTDE